MMDIYVLTFNRLPYLQKNIWSILASTKGRYQITVLDDGSNDGTRQWLTSMRKRKGAKLIKLIFPKVKLGTAKGFNKLIDSGSGKSFVFCNDDMWFKDGWLETAMRIYKKYDDCGVVSLYNYSAVGKTMLKDLGDEMLLVASGLGACLMDRDLWNDIGGFVLPENQTMGFFASKFCSKCLVSEVKRNKIYMPKNPAVLNMDLVGSVLCERDVLVEYGEYRKEHKK